jgi:protein-tyrosine phosphatase
MQAEDALAMTRYPHVYVQVVVHCWAGGKRSGSVLAAWLVAQHNLSPEAAVQELKRTAESQGSTRPADAQWATQYVAGIKL